MEIVKVCTSLDSWIADYSSCLSEWTRSAKIENLEFRLCFIVWSVESPSMDHKICEARGGWGEKTRGAFWASILPAPIHLFSQSGWSQSPMTAFSLSCATWLFLRPFLSHVRTTYLLLWPVVQTITRHYPKSVTVGDVNPKKWSK